MSEFPSFDKDDVKRAKRVEKMAYGLIVIVLVLIFQAAVIGAYVAYFVWTFIAGLFK